MDLTDLANLATALGVPVAIVLIWFDKRRERRDREYGTYDALDDKYRDFLALCIDHPQLDLFDVPLKNAKRQSLPATDGPPEVDLQSIRQMALFDILVSLLERSFLMYSDQSNTLKRQQWNGWVEYIDSYCQHPTFRSLWVTRGSQYDGRFLEFMNRRITTVSSSIDQPKVPQHPS